MRSLLYLIAVILVIAWIFGAFITPFGGGLIHILLVIAVIALLLGIIRRA
jgi:Sec-independent protein secretion pathway component TatC